MTIIPEDLSIHKPKQALLDKINSIEIKEKVLFKKESDFHSLSVVQNDFGKFIKFDDTYQAGYINSKTYKGNLPYINYFLIPCFMNEKIKDILFIGLGSGIILNEYEKRLKNLKNIDIVDIDEYIFPLAQKYFDFKISDKMNFYLQDAIVFLKTASKKYDLIVVDIADDMGIDDRLYEFDYLNLIKSKLKKGGIFVSNMPSSCDIFNEKNKVVLDLIENYKNTFNFVDLYNGSTSNRIFYKVFYDIDEVVYDVTNLILISSDKRYEIKNDEDYNEYISDLAVDFGK